MKVQEGTTALAVREKVDAPIETFSVRIPANAKPEEVLATVDACGEALSDVERANSKLRYVLGKTLAHVRSRKLFRPRYKTFESYLQAEVLEKHNLKRASVLAATRAMRLYPELPADEATKIPWVTMANICRLAKVVTPAKRQRLLEDGQSMTIVEFEDKWGGAGAAVHSGYAVIRIPTTKRTKARWEKWLGDRDPEEVIEAIITGEPLSA